jgi:NADH-quinone oxidoreductase subunit H
VQVLRGVAVISFALVLVWLAVGRGWDAPSSLQLIRVTDFAPREVEPGDRIAIFGEGFPSGKPARVTFRGVLHRPGALAQKGAEVSVWGTVVAPDRVEVAFDDAAEALFCGVGERAIHTTFEGDLEVAFASALPGAPPIAGFLGGVTVDVRPGPTPGGVERDREADRLLAFLGLHLTAKPRGGGLLVDAVEPDSRAQAAGIAAGDTLESFDGVRVRSPGDVMPAADEHDATVTLRRVSLADPLVRSVCVAGFRPELPAGWVTSALLVFGALGIAVAFAAPAPTSLSTWIQFAIGRARERLAARRARGSLRAAVAVAWAEVGHEVMPAGPFAIVDAAAWALIAILPFGQFRAASTLDAGILFTGSATALVAASLVSARPFASRIRRALHVGWQHAPALAPIACVVLATGSFRVQEIARAQGGSPWEWLAFRSPAAPIAIALLLSCMRIDLVREGSRGAREVGESQWLRAVTRGHRTVVAGLASVLFLGAWSLPGVTFAEQDAHPPLQLAGVACLMAKTAVVLLGMAWSRWALAPLPLQRRSWAATLWLIPAGVVAFGAMAFWSVWSPRPALQATMTGSLLISAALVGAALAHRLRRGLLSGENGARLSPFL